MPVSGFTVLDGMKLGCGLLLSIPLGALALIVFVSADFSDFVSYFFIVAIGIAVGIGIATLIGERTNRRNYEDGTDDEDGARP